MNGDDLELSVRTMDAFARRTGLEPARGRTRRYLWTDAFAVCVYLDLHRRTGGGRYLELALRLVDQVHRVLGQHRPDDRRSGWISGLSGEEGTDHPTAGGLRIGKAMPERAEGELADPMLEWEQDGQYYHYLTKWMHALERVAAATGEVRYLRWSLELAGAAHAHFAYPSSGRRKRMYWKMSIDLARPLVASMGQHDALDGLATFLELSRARERFPGQALPDLSGEIGELSAMARPGQWATDDPLGAGALLADAWKLMQANGEGRALGEVLDAARLSVDHIATFHDLSGPAEGRLAFRELGLSIGLHAVEAMGEAVGRGGAVGDRGTAERVDGLKHHIPLAEQIERFWSDPVNRGARTWEEHEDINAVMLAASLGPGELLRI